MIPAVTHPAAFRTERLVLQTLGPDRAAHVSAHAAANREHLAPWEPLRDPEWLTLDAVRARLAEDVAIAHEGQGLRLWLFLHEDTEMVIGMVNLANVVRGAFLSCHVGYHLDARYTGQGLMTEAVTEAVRIAFDILCLHRVEANVMPRNTRSAAVALAAGFVSEGISPRYLNIAGRWEDHEHYVILNPALEQTA